MISDEIKRSIYEEEMDKARKTGTSVMNFCGFNIEVSKPKSIYQIEKEKLAEKIEKALETKKNSVSWEKNSDSKQFSLTMKATGNVIIVKLVRVPPHKCMGHWCCTSFHYEVSGDGIEGIRYFNGLDGLAKSMAYGYIK